MSHKEKPDYESAIDNYNKAIDYNSNFAYAYLNRGIVYKDNGPKDKDKAIKDFNKVLELNNNAQASKEAKNQLQELGTK